MFLSRMMYCCFYYIKDLFTSHHCSVHLSEWTKCSLVPQDVYRLPAASDLYTGPVPGLQCQEQQVSEERLLPLWHWCQYLDATQRGHVSWWGTKVGVWPSGSWNLFLFVAPWLLVSFVHWLGNQTHSWSLWQVTVIWLVKHA